MTEAPKVERRAAVEVRAAGRKLVGYAAIFDSQVPIADFREVVRRGAFAASLKSGADILGLADHDMRAVLARTKSGTLRLAEDTRGLHFDLDVPPTTVGNDLLALAERGDIGGASFGFSVPKGGERWNGTLRELVAVDLKEISVVQSFAAYPQTSVTARHRPDPLLSRVDRLLWGR